MSKVKTLHEYRWSRDQAARLPELAADMSASEAKDGVIGRRLVDG